MVIDIQYPGNSDTFRGGNPPQRLGAIFVSDTTFSFLSFYFFSLALEKWQECFADFASR